VKKNSINAGNVRNSIDSIIAQASLTAPAHRLFQKNTLLSNAHGLLLSLIALGLLATPTYAKNPSAIMPTTKAWAAVSGQSMLPTFPLNALVEMEIGVPFANLKVGDTVIFWDYQRGERCLTHHRLIARRGSGWISQGDNKKTNPIADRTWITSENYIARTTGRFTQFLAATPVSTNYVSGNPLPIEALATR
jgi:hypothetical protein